MKTGSRQQQVLGQQLALSSYIDALLEASAAPVAEPEPGADVQIVADVHAQGSTAHGIPEWAGSRFQTLLFEVAGLTLAVPLVKLKGVVPNNQGCTSMPGHSSLFIGVVPYQGQQSKVIDTARFLLPEGQAAQLSGDAGERMQHLIMIDGGRWALACNRIGDVIELGSDDVKWRGRKGKRLWLAGTVIERMCALLDIDQLTRQLVEGMA